MAKTSAQRQREYKQRLKEQGRYAQWKEKVKVTMRKRRAKLKQTKQGREHLNAEYRRQKQAQRARQKIRDQEGTDTEKPSSSTAFKSRQHFGKCRKRVEEALPQSPRKRKEIIRKLAVEEGLHVGKPYKCVPVSGKQLSEELKTEIIKFYNDDSISYQAPGRDDFINIHVQGETKEVRIRYLIVTLKEAHALFLQDREEMSVGLTKFAELRPAHVRLQSKIPHNVCTCIIHENAKFLLKALCKKQVLTETEFRKFIAQVVCDQNSSECMQGGCAKCPGLNQADISEELANSRCGWNQWNSRNGRFEIEVKEGSVKDCIEELTNCLPRFLNHVYVKRQQSEAFEKARENVTINEAVIQIDFSENYTCKEQNEIQAAHWNNTQISIFTAVAWYRNEGIGEIQKRSFALVSDYVSHDKYAVDICLRKVFSEMLDIVPNLELVKVFSDGAASHFKQKYTLSHVTYISEVFGFQIEWHFFESYHGKGAVDAIGGQVKRMAWTATKAGGRIQSAEEFVNTVRKKTKISVLEVSLPEIEEAKEFLNKRFEHISPIPSTQRVHYVKALKLNVVEYAYLSCVESVKMIHKFRK